MNNFSRIGYNIDIHTGYIFASGARIKKLSSILDGIALN